jgi:hypothetical protein
MAIIFALGCGNKKSNNDSIETLELVVLDSLYLPLDHLSNPYTLSMQFFKNKEGTNYFTILNQLVNGIYFYNLSTREIEKVVKFDVAGPNGVDSMEGYFIHNEDSIFVNSRYKVSLVNSERVLLNSWDLVKGATHSITGLPKLNTFNPAVVANGKLHFDLNPDIWLDNLEEVKKAPIRISIDMTTSNQRSYFHYPAVYFKDIYSGQFLVFYASCYNPEEKIVVHSFPAYKNLIVSDVEGNILKEVPTPSNYFKEVKPFNKKSDESVYAEQVNFFFATSSYSSLSYDPFRKLYYRFTALGVSEEKMEIKPRFKETSVIVLDKDFNLIGEFMLDPSYQMDKSIQFIDERGLNIFSDTGEEGRMKFYTISFKPKA